MSQIIELEKKLKEAVSIPDISFCITKVDKSNRKARVNAQIKSEAILNRLDAIFGIDGWRDSYVVSYNCVICKLSLNLGDSWNTKESAAPFMHSASLNEAFTDALRQAAIRFGLGRYLLSQSGIYVEIFESRPTNHKNELHSFQSDELSGWWEEPDFASLTNSAKDDGSKSQSTQPDFGKLSLSQKLEYLFKQKIISKKKYDNYSIKINDKTTAPGLLRYFEKQFNLLQKLDRAGAKISVDLRATTYKRIMASKMAELTLIESELKVLEAA